MASRQALPRILLVSDWPPVASGIGVSSSIVLERLFSAYPRDFINYASLSTYPDNLDISRQVQERLIRVSVFPGDSSRLSEISRWANHLIHPLLEKKIQKLCRNTTADIIFASPILYGYLFRAAVDASEKLRIPLVTYFLDDWAEWYRVNWPRLSNEAAQWQTKAIKSSSIIYTNGPGMKADYKKRYNVDASILTNVVNVAAFDNGSSRSSPDSTDIRKIIYVGTVYGAQHCAIDDLIKALDIVNKSRIRCVLELYSNLSPTDLGKWGWNRSYVFIKPWANQSEMPIILRSADILFLPLTFDPKWSFTIRTSAPGKLAEYAASGRPIIVHAPAEADISMLCKERNLGVVVDLPDPLLLAEEILKIIEDKEYAAELSQRAIEIAYRYYNQCVVQMRLYDDLLKLKNYT